MSQGTGFNPQANRLDVILQSVTALRQKIAELEFTVSEQEEALRESARRVEQAKQEWEVTVDSLPQLVILLDYGQRIIRTNRALERWDLGQIGKVKGELIHTLFSSGSGDLANQMRSFLERSWPVLTKGKTVTVDIEDQSLGCKYHLQLNPLSMETSRQDKTTYAFAVLIMHDLSTG